MDPSPTDTLQHRPSRMEIFEIWLTTKGDRSARGRLMEDAVLDFLGVKQDANTVISAVRNIIRDFNKKLWARWEKSKRTKDRFLRNNLDWLKKDFLPSATDTDISQMPSTSKGRPRKTFEESSERSKRRKIGSAVKTYGEKELTYAAKLSLRKAGKSDAAKLLQEATLTTPKRASKIRSAWKSAQMMETNAFSAESALSLLVEAKLSKHQYILMRQQAKKIGRDIYPSYHKILTAKKQCYPGKEDIIISEDRAEVKLQGLMNHTVTRIVSSQEEVVSSFYSNELQNLVLISKWGFDGSTGHSEYKQKSSEDSVDGDIFVTSVVPVQLFFASKTGEKILWKNPCPSSTRYCRPIRFQFKKETTDLSKSEAEYIEEQIRNLAPTTFIFNLQSFTIRHVMILTMVDGKVCNAITSTSSAQKCYVCGATPKLMNDIDNVTAVHRV